MDSIQYSALLKLLKVESWLCPNFPVVLFLVLIKSLGPLKSVDKGRQEEAAISTPADKAFVTIACFFTRIKEFDFYTPMQITVRTIIFPNKINRLQWPVAINQTTLILSLKTISIQSF